MTADDVAFADATALGRMIARRKISSLELTKLYLARLEKYGNRYGAVVTIMHDRALREARKADRDLASGIRRSPLHGVPYGAKDLIAANGAPTTWGAAPYRRRVLDFDATVVEKLHDAGAVLCAKLATIELAGGFGYNNADASFTGPARTPWNPDFWAGGSSSGPGAATAGGLVGFSIGSETNGSITVPSAFCAVSGLRPTYGRVSRHGAMALMWSSDKLGPMCRSARDAETVLRVIAGRDPNDASSVQAPFPALRSRRPKIGVLRDATRKTMPEVARNFQTSLDRLAEFCDIVPDVALPRGPYEEVFWTLLSGEAAAAFRDLIESGRSRQLRCLDDRIGGYGYYGTLAVDYVDAMRKRKILNRAVIEAFEPFDAIVHPTTPTVAYPIGVPFDKAYPKFGNTPSLGSPGNLAGLPAISVPNGFGRNGLPTAIVFVGRLWGELPLTHIAKALQARTDFHARRPL